MTKGFITILKRELASYFATPVAYVFIIIFLVMAGFLTFNIGNFFETHQADLRPFFSWHPWLYLFFVPAVAMRLWTEERRSGTIELLLTMPVSMIDAVAGKFVAAWIIVAISLFLTFPMIFTVTYLGEPDMGVIITGYMGSLLMAGAYLAIGSCFSALVKSQVVSFIISVVTIFLLMVAGMASLWMPSFIPSLASDALGTLSLLNHFDSIQRGVIDLRDLIYYTTIIIFSLVISSLIIEEKKAI
ncbi:MAG: ABC transporter permease subunit [Deltaproteobacteria bacterium]|nr:ABC transporter permease subunit [Deltaproteobacteria bacterium]